MIGFGAMDVTKPYKFIGFGAIDVTKPNKLIGFGAISTITNETKTLTTQSTPKTRLLTAEDKASWF